MMFDRFLATVKSPNRKSRRAAASRSKRQQRKRVVRSGLTFERFEDRRMLAGMSSTGDPNDEICETDLTLLDGQTLTGTINPITDVDLCVTALISMS